MIAVVVIAIVLGVIFFTCIGLLYAGVIHLGQDDTGKLTYNVDGKAAMALVPTVPAVVPKTQTETITETKEEVVVTAEPVPEDVEEVVVIAEPVQEEVVVIEEPVPVPQMQASGDAVAIV